MIAIPFLFFGLLFIDTWKRRGYDVYAYMLSLFVIISFFSILMDEMDLYKTFNNPKESLGLVAPLTYCILLFACIHPYRKFDSRSIMSIVKLNEKMYNRVVYIYFTIFLIVLLISITRINEIIAAQNLAALRNEYYNGDVENIWTSFTGYTRYLIGIISMLSGSARILLVFFFINIVFLKKKLWFNVITILGSTTPLLLSLYIVDRSAYIHWFLQLGLFFVLFKHLLKKTDWVHFVAIGVPLLFVVGTYVYNVTFSRFGDSGPGVWGGIVYYAGQSYIHFCYFFNKLDFNSPFSLVEVFPFTCKIILKTPSYFDQCEIVSKYCGMHAATFSTFLGLIMSISGKIVMTIYAIIYIVCSNKIVSRPRKSIISLKKLVRFYIFAIVIVNGLFGYCYLEYVSIFNILIWLFIAKICTERKVKYEI